MQSWISAGCVSVGLGRTLRSVGQCIVLDDPALEEVEGVPVLIESVIRHDVVIVFDT